MRIQKLHNSPGIHKPQHKLVVLFQIKSIIVISLCIIGGSILKGYKSPKYSLFCQLEQCLFTISVSPTVWHYITGERVSGCLW